MTKKRTLLFVLLVLGACALAQDALAQDVEGLVGLNLSYVPHSRYGGSYGSYYGGYRAPDVVLSWGLDQLGRELDSRRYRRDRREAGYDYEAGREAGYNQGRRETVPVRTRAERERPATEWTPSWQRRQEAERADASPRGKARLVNETPSPVQVIIWDNEEYRGRHYKMVSPGDEVELEYLPPGKGYEYRFYLVGIDAHGRTERRIVHPQQTFDGLRIPWKKG